MRCASGFVEYVLSCARYLAGGVLLEPKTRCDGWAGYRIGSSLFSRRSGLRPVDRGVVDRKFHRLSPNEIWITDIPEHPTTWIPAREGKT